MGSKSSKDSSLKTSGEGQFLTTPTNQFIAIGEPPLLFVHVASISSVNIVPHGQDFYKIRLNRVNASLVSLTSKSMSRNEVNAFLMVLTGQTALFAPIGRQDESAIELHDAPSTPIRFTDK